MCIDHLSVCVCICFVLQCARIDSIDTARTEIHCAVHSYRNICIVIWHTNKCCFHCVQIEADKILSPILRRGIIKRFFDMDGETQKSFHPHQGLRHRWSKILEKVWDAERWDTPENIRQCDKRYEEWKTMVSIVHIVEYSQECQQTVHM